MDSLQALTTFINQWDWITPAKVIMTVVMFVAALTGFYIAIKADFWTQRLIEKEEELIHQRDEVMFQSTMARAQLAELNERIQRKINYEESPQEATAAVLKTISPVLMMLFRKERSILKWSLAAANLGRTIFGRMKK